MTDPHQPTGAAFDTPRRALERWDHVPTKGPPVSDNTPDAPSPDSASQPAPAAYPPPATGATPPPAPPAYGSAPQYGAPQAPYGAAPQYGATAPYGSAPQYGTAPQYGAPGAYGYGAPKKTNTLAIVSLIASLAALVIVPFIGSLVGVITGHMALGQIKRSGEEGRGLALAGTIVGWVGLGLAIIGIIFFIVIIGIAASMPSNYYGY